MLQLLQAFQNDRDFQTILSGIRSGMREQLVSGLAGSARQVMVAALHQNIERPLLIVTHNLYAAQKMMEDLQEICDEDSVMLYPANELTLIDIAASSPETVAQRIAVLSRLSQGYRGIVIVPYAGLRRLLPVKETYRDAQLTLRVGEEVPLAELSLQLVRLGYERTDMVEKKGEFSIRGGIMDVYPLTADEAYRIEWFDDEIDSIRTFDPSDQRSIHRVESLTITPAREIIADEQRMAKAADHAAELLNEQLAKMTDRRAKEQLEEHIREDIARLRDGHYFQEIYKYISLLYPERQTIIDYMPEDTIMIVDEPNRLLETARQLERDEGETVTDLLSEGRTLPAFVLSKTHEQVLQYKKFPMLYIQLFLRQVPHTQPQNIVNFVTRAMQNFHGQMNVLKAEADRWAKAETQVLILASDEERINRLRRVLADYKIETPRIIKGNLQSGFEFPTGRIAVITEGEVFSQKQRKVRRSDRKIDNAERIKSYTELKVGDYVVHVNHGIGKYVGIGTLEIDGIHKDYLHILYAGGDKLSVPIDQIDLVQKYVGAEEKEPKLYKLGGTEWQRAKSKARKSVQDIADDLIKLYAERQASRGYAFSKDTPYQKEFESMFMYNETPDQLRAIEEIKRDMESPVPMDRLLCGDVGYGKTEVAIRAAFKVAIEGKQVAVLVPTTILAQQHFETFKERFSGFPFEIHVLSRFRSRKEQNETIKGLKLGTVDIVIGTHRLLSNDVQFKDLGLLIVDEEQRFGVAHKEKLKRLKTNVDVLTLTATPIPRTLHMSMLGVRDLSVIETPPENRFPVQTYVVEHSNSLIREAVERELARGGQVYYLYNRVQGIHQMAEHIQNLVPDARVAVGHGKMSEQELEKVILDFLDGEYDVLVSTTIIETGVDIPNVNTLIVHDADKMGLSQLYQLRGRVGRSNRIAYAYFTYQKDKVLNETAEKRLQAIKEFTELGSGFRIAMRDLAIRGAGNLLGAEQHGFISSVGFELYTQMLAEEIEKRKLGLQGAEVKEESKEFTTQIDLPIDAYLPTEYIYDSMQKIEIYKKTAAVRTLDDAEQLREEIIDRFGPMPQAVQNLLAVARLKAYGNMYKIISITQKGHEVSLIIDESQNAVIDGQKLFALGSQFSRRVQFKSGSKIHIVFNCRGLTPEETVELLEQFLSQYQDCLKPKEVLQHAAK
ncbi:transcription-repair-coupling factor [Insulibacter thermoxylanivorax]|uniref:Transcription-repair-coupling factor n=1 Tax=Insulibacter thermoxylanivorax TaxID=2749268 RepID=A0A916QCV4_9BACL|nr:transcription-repair coupling factor [Insulibacter thermoxylanivorax]GFR38411.1 transcription-repair-coupling factor [Insulibacter thermoxylanivorax]